MRAISEVSAQSWPQVGLSDLLRRFGRGRPACAPMGWGSRLNPKYRRSFRLWAVLVLAFPSLAWSPAWGADPPVASEVGQRTAQLLAELIRIPTVNPPGGEERLAERLAAELAGAGLETRVIPTPRADPSDPARAAVWARLPGRGIQPPLILLSHLDVVPADPSAWQHPPFAGVIENGTVHGRGALDAKGVTAVHVSTLLELAAREQLPDRDIIFLATPDEETGGRAGAQYIVRQHPELLAGAEFLLTEGGSIRPARAQRQGMRSVPPMWGVTVTEKGPCWLQLKTRGTAGHGSAPRGDAAVPRLVEALDRVRRIETPIRVLDEVATMFRALAPSAPPEDQAGFANLAQGLASDSSFRRRFLANPGYNALVRNTISITVLEAGSSTNVVPGEASARLDIRLLPGEDCSEFVGALTDVIGDPHVEVEILLSFPSHSSSAQTALFEAIDRVAHRKNPEAIVVPRMIGGFTDAHWFREQEIVAYGFVPRWLSRSETRGVHGIDERVSIANLEAGVSTLLEIIDELDRIQAQAVSVDPGPGSAQTENLLGD
jgi:acetylornithine deacetylase/succinyl-diaminopimelate desuccinylase-like protein